MSRVAIVATANAVRADGSEPLILARDLRAPKAGEAVVWATLDRFGRIDALTCIAGAVPQCDMFEPTDEQWDDGLASKFHSARRLTIARGRRSRSHGSVAITSGTFAYTPKASLAAVGAVNAAILAVAKAFADRGHQGWRAGQQVPAGIGHDGPATQAHMLELDAATERFSAEVRIARCGRPDDIARLKANGSRPRRCGPNRPSLADLRL